MFILCLLTEVTLRYRLYLLSVVAPWIDADFGLHLLPPIEENSREIQ